MPAPKPVSKTKSESPGVSDHAPATLASTVYDRLRADILTGELEPGRKLRIEFLGKRYHTGHSPIREALNRLSSDGLVERRDQRGFLVAAASAEDLAELTKARCWLEGLALSESIAARTQAWEEGVVIAYHRLSRAPRSMSPKVYRENPEWESLHRAFHLSLIAGCGSRWLLVFCAQLADQSYRYRRIAFQRAFPLRNNTHGHQAIMDAALEGNTDKAVRLLQMHLRFTADTILKNGAALNAPPGATKRYQPKVQAGVRRPTARRG
jgi:DNA-binding GntR family transcriptional regulator